MPRVRLRQLLVLLILLVLSLAVLRLYPRFVSKPFRPIGQPRFERFDMETRDELPQFSDRFEAYAHWWHEGNRKEEDWVVYDEQGKRKATFFYVPSDPPVMTAEEAVNANVQSSTLVLGISMNGAQRAYPLKFLGFELLNDHLAGIPIAVSW